MQRKSTTLSLVALASLLVGCEWTSSSGGSSSWSDSYDAMNFAGTYRISTIVQSGTSNDDSSASGSQFTDSFSTVTAEISEYSGTTSRHPIVKKSVTIRLGSSYAFHDLDGSGTLTSENITGTATINYSNGNWAIHFSDVPTAAIGQKITVSYQVGTSTYGIDTTIYDPTLITAITVSQTGQYLTMKLNNGVSMSGRFTTVRQTGQVNEDTGAGANTYNAQFEVSGGNSKLVGTLNYDYPSHNRYMDGTWTYGNKVYDVHAIGPAWTESGATTLTTESN